MRRFFLPVVLSFLLLMPALAAKKTRLHTLGDSTMEQQDPDVKDQRGWVQMLQSFFSDDLIVVDPAKSGTSTKTYYRNGYWERAKKNIQPGDYVLIQFAHNDEKHNGKDGETGTAPTDSFRIYLTRYVKEVRSLGANPILCTPVVRKMFDKSGKLSRRGKHDLGEFYKQKIDPAFDANDTFTYNYPANMKFVARELKCPLIDMTALTAQLVDSLGDSKAGKLIYNLPGDGTHFGANGALLFSKQFVNELQRQHLLTEYLRPQKQLITNPSAITINNCFVGTEALKTFDVGYAGRIENGGSKITVNVTKGFKISSFVDSVFSDKLDLAIKPNHSSVFKVYLKNTPLTVGVQKGQLSATLLNGETNIIPVTVNAIEIADNQPFSITYKLVGSSKADVKGAVSAFEEQWKNMEIVKYAAPEDDANYTNTRVQVNNISGGVWPGNEIDVVYSRFLQFGFRASEQAKAYPKSIELYLGGGVNFRVVASLTEDFNNAFTLGEATDVKNKEILKYSFPTSQTIETGKVIYIRIYPWGNKKIANPNLLLSNISITGICQK